MSVKGVDCFEVLNGAESCHFIPIAVPSVSDRCKAMSEASATFPSFVEWLDGYAGQWTPTYTSGYGRYRKKCSISDTGPCVIYMYNVLVLTICHCA